MSALLSADPQQIRWAASALDSVADDAAALVRTVDRAQPPCWQAPSRRDYTGQLVALSRRLDGLARSHDRAVEALRSYVARLEDAQDRARRADTRARDARQALADAASRPGPRQLGPHPAQGELAQALESLADAERDEREAAARAAAVLRDLAARAPEQAVTSWTLRLLEDAVGTAVDGVTGLPGAVRRGVGTVWAALPFGSDDDEQDEARRALLEAAKVWEGWLDTIGEAAEGRPGIAVGSVLGLGGLPRTVTAAFPDPSRVKGRGRGEYLDGVREGVLTVDDFSEAWDQAHAAKDLQDRIVRLRDRPLPGVEALLAGDVDLAHHEARGGHTILKHVGVRIETLLERLRLEAPGDANATRSTFPDLATAEELVRRALQSDPGKLKGLVDSPIAKHREFHLDLDEPVGTVVRGDGTVHPGRRVVVIVTRKGGDVRVETAFLEPTHRSAGR